MVGKVRTVMSLTNLLNLASIQSMLIFHGTKILLVPWYLLVSGFWSLVFVLPLWHTTLDKIK